MKRRYKIIGCFGNYWADKYLEKEPMQHLDKENIFMRKYCDYKCNINNVEFEKIAGIDWIVCPNCKIR